MFKFSVLGPVRAWHDDTEIDLGSPQQLALLGLLLVRAGEPVTVSEIIDVLWPDGAPATASNLVHRYVSRLRRLLPEDTLGRSARAYRLDVPAGALDLHEFRRALQVASRLAEPDHAAGLIADALRRWRGPVAANIDPAIRSAPVFAAIDEEYTTAALRAAGLAISPDTARLVLPVVRAATGTAPLDESLHAALMRLLALSGRPADALVEFANLRDRLTAQLGVDPGPQVREIHQRLLRGEPGAPPPPRNQPPQQLPADLGVFTGRATEVRGLIRFLRGAHDPGQAARVAVITGGHGIGKTTLAVHLAHELAHSFPDGNLYIDLHGSDPSRMVRTDDVFRRLLDTLGVGAHAVPGDLDERIGLYRSLLAGRQVLVVLDDAPDAARARPFLPGAPGSAAIVTSRDPLAGLVVGEGASPLVLGPLTDAEAHTFLRRRLGAHRVLSEPDATRQIVRACGGLPLALALVTARAGGNPRFRLDDLAAELTAARGRMPHGFRVI